MTQKVSPFLEGKYGWDFGEDGWNNGMDENLLKFSFMFDRNIDSIVDSLPAPSNGLSVYLTTDKRFYFSVGTTWYSCPVPKWCEFSIKSTGVLYRFDGTSISEVPSSEGVQTQIDEIEVTLSSLGTAAYQDESYFATQGSLDVGLAQANDYTDTLRSTLGSAGGAELVFGATEQVDSVVELVGKIGSYVGDVVETASYYAGWSTLLSGPVGGATFVWDATRPKSQHNGGNIISPTVPWDGTESSLAAYIAKTGETDAAGFGCWVHKNLRGNEYNVLQWGAKNDASTNGANDAMIQPLLDYIEAPVGGGFGGVVNFPRGNYRFNNYFNVRDRTTLRGEGTSATIIQFLGTAVGNCITLGPTGPNHPLNPNGHWVFGVRLESLAISGGNTYKGSDRALVYTDGAHEHSGLFNVVLRDFLNFGVHYATGNGGPALFEVSDVEIYGADVAPTLGSKRGICCNAAGALILVRHATITGGDTNKLTHGILMLKDSLVAEGVHFENAVVGVSLSQSGTPSVNKLSGITGNQTVERLVDIASTFTGSVSAQALLNKSLEVSDLVVLINRANNNQTFVDRALSDYSWPESFTGTQLFVDATAFGVGSDGADYTTQLQSAINFAAAAVSGGQGMKVLLPRGKIGISDTIVQPNRVAIHGANGRGTIIEALDTFNPAATEMLNASNGTFSMFGARLVDLWFHMRGKGASTGRCIYTVAMQETCGLERVLLMGFNRYGLEYDNGHGGAAYLPLKDVEIFAGSEGTTPTAGIQINQVSLVGGFVLSVDGCTIAGSPPGSSTPYQLPIGIRLANDTFVGRGLHFEACKDCVVSLGAGSVSIDTITGSSNGVVDSLVTLGSSWTGTLSVQNSITNGAANHVRNNANAAVIPSVAGMQPLITHPDKAQSAPLAWVVFDASATAVGGQCAILAKSANITGVLKTAVGRFSVQYAYSQPTGKSRSAGGGITNLNNNDPIKIVHAGGSANADFIEVRRKVSDTTWSDYDPQRIGLQFFGDRL